MAICFLALGSNLGKREEHIQNAIEELKNGGAHVQKVSGIIETKPQGGPLQGDYLNAVAKIETQLPPQELLQLIQSVEQRLGRERAVLNGPRTIDIDLLIYDHLKINTPQLTVPHPRMLQREFVMIPLLEIAPELTAELAHAYHP